MSTSQPSSYKYSRTSLIPIYWGNSKKFIIKKFSDNWIFWKLPNVSCRLPSNRLINKISLITNYCKSLYFHGSKFSRIANMPVFAILNLAAIVKICFFVISWSIWIKQKKGFMISLWWVELFTFSFLQIWLDSRI